MRYYFHVVTDTRFVRDPDGGEFAGLDEAEAEAAQSARDLMAAELERGHAVPCAWRLLLATQDDTVLMSLPFSAIADGTRDYASPHRHASAGQSERERRSLAETERLISKARAHVEAQRARIAILESDCRDTSLANALLGQLEKTFQCMMDRRHTIIKQLARLEQ